MASLNIALFITFYFVLVKSTPLTWDRARGFVPFRIRGTSGTFCNFIWLKAFVAPGGFVVGRLHDVWFMASPGMKARMIDKIRS